MSAGLVLEQVSIALAGTPLFQPLTLAVAPGEIATVMGPSGSGKSSLLAYVSGALAPAFAATGRVLLDGDDVGGLPAEARRIGILFQDDLLFPHLTVAENLAFGLAPAYRGKARAERVAWALAEAELPGLGRRDPATLSGGQRARVALLRALLAEPRALLLDEPFAKLDQALKTRIRKFVFEHARAARTPTLLVTHDPADAAAAGGRVVELAAVAEASRR